jgi:hypothetical protein
MYDKGVNLYHDDDDDEDEQGCSLYSLAEQCCRLRYDMVSPEVSTRCRATGAGYEDYLQAMQ